MFSVINRYKKRKVDYPDLNLAQSPLPHSDILPVHILSEQELEFAYEDSKMIVEDQCGPTSHEDDEIEIEAEVSALLDTMETKLIRQKDLNDLCGDLKLIKDKSEILGSRLKHWNLLQADTRTSFLKYCEKEFSELFSEDDDLYYCNDVSRLIEALRIEYKLEN